MSVESHLVPELDAGQLRKFGLLTGSIVAVLFGGLLPWVLDRSLPLWPWLVFAVLGAWGLLAPRGLRPVYRGWMRFGHFMGRITTPLILALTFYVVVFPIALLKRLFGTDAMARRLDPAAETYRIPSRKPPSNHLTRPY